MRLFRASAVVLLLVACQAPAPEMTEADRQAIAAEIRQRGEDLFKPMAEPMDITAAMAFYLDDADSYFVGDPAVGVFNTRTIGSVQEFREMMQGMAEGRRGTSVEITDNRVAVLSPDHAIQVLSADYAITSLEGEVRTGWRMVHTHVWVREAGEWKLLHFHESYRAPTG